MSDTDTEIKQCERILVAIQANLDELKAEKQKRRKHKLGDIVRSHVNRYRVILFSGEYRKLCAFDRRGKVVEVGQSNINKFYESTGQNIFTDNLLNLDK